MAPYEALYGRKCRSPIRWFEMGESSLFGPDLVHQAVEKVKHIPERLRITQSCQKSYSDVCRRDLEFQLELVHPVFHVSMLRKYIRDPSRIVPVENVQVMEDLLYEEIPIAILDRQVYKLRMKEVASVKVLWCNKNVEKVTWEAEKTMKAKYLHLFQPEGSI
ncbi:uncharacterized protein LOC132637673 [Lycium barbarum]|uniref:uncharacterized protein LOC132637673 n=1 Tax=Lycium barbarum TaxID=112863 RepID=UPI00293E12CB|nr:uncharacterized protein LOC132637673 [Lycium barbarum]